MPTKKPKKLRIDQVRRDLELLFCGASGGRWSEEYDPDLVSQLGSESLSRFVWAIRNWFFSGWDDCEKTYGLFQMNTCEAYRSLDTLAEKIVTERFRVDNLNAEGGGDGK